MGKGRILVEGHGEVAAAANLVTRLWADLGLYELTPTLAWTDPVRWPNLHIQEGVDKGCKWAASQPNTAALLILRDEDDACPRTTGPETAGWVPQTVVDFPVAVTLFRREYEVLFLASLESIRGQTISDKSGMIRPGVAEDAAFEADLESIRDVKGWFTAQFPANRAYKPTLDQLPLTRMIDFTLVRASGLPCFGTLERALQFLAQNQDSNTIYPPPA